MNQRKILLALDYSLFNFVPYCLMIWYGVKLIYFILISCIMTWALILKEYPHLAEKISIVIQAFTFYLTVFGIALVIFLIRTAIRRGRKK